MSISGARVRVHRGITLPPEVTLVHLREWTAYRARVVWSRADGNVGLALSRSWDLEGAIGAELRVMREYCAALEDLS